MGDQRRAIELEDFAFTGPGSLAGRYLRRFWQPVGLASKLARGRATPVRVMGEDFTLYRGASGAPYLAPFRCPHRGLQLSVGWVEDDSIRCRYHGWKFDSTGQCVAMPAEDPGFPTKVKVPMYPATEYLGIIFGYFGEGEPPPLPRYPEMEAEGVLEPVVYVRGCNHFNQLENMLDITHQAFLHQNTVFGRDQEDLPHHPERIPVPEAKETDWGMEVRWPREGLPTYVQQILMPNVWSFKIPRVAKGRLAGYQTDAVFIPVPIDDHSHRVYSLYNIHATGEARAAYLERRGTWTGGDFGHEPQQFADAVLRGERRLAERNGEDAILVSLTEDSVGLTGQGTLPDRRTWRFGRSDVGIILLHAIWKRELAALSAGQSLKQWQRTPELVTVA